MSAILSTDDLNDFISPSVACIKPVETLPDVARSTTYEVSTEDQSSQAQNTAQISLTDCLACSGCVTSAEAVLVSMQSHAEVLNALEGAPSFPFDQSLQIDLDDGSRQDSKIFIASISPQVRASLAASYEVCETEAYAMVEQLLCGPAGLAKGGSHGSRFAWLVDTNVFRDIALAMCAKEVAPEQDSPASPRKMSQRSTNLKHPILTSACPGWICYAEKTHPHVLPYLSKVKSPQALAGTMLKTVLARALAIDPAQIWHLAIMPCFDKKLEASRPEFTDAVWRGAPTKGSPVRDVDCVITAREIVMLAEARGISFATLSRLRVSTPFMPHFPDPLIRSFLFDSSPKSWKNEPLAGSSGGYLYEILCVQRAMNPGSLIQTSRGRNSDLVEYNLIQDGKVIFKGARYYGFRNIQNLVRKLKPSKVVALERSPNDQRTRALRKPNIASTKDMDYAYIEVMACPGGCTNGGGQIRVADLDVVQSPVAASMSPKDWLAKVDDVYFTSHSDKNNDAQSTELGTENCRAFKLRIDDVVSYWSKLVGISTDKLLWTTYRKVESDIGKGKLETEKVAALAGKMGGGW